MLRTVVLHGALGREFGERFTLDVASPLEAVRALMVQLRGFRQRLRDGHYRVVRRTVHHRESDLSLEELALRLGRAPEIHIVPVVAGSAKGLGKILAGAAIIGLAIVAPYVIPAFATGGSLAFIAGTSGLAFKVGLGLVAGGVAQMLSPSPQLKGGSAAQDRMESYLFGGQQNVATQGGPVPLVFGTFLVGSVTVSAGLAIEQI